LETPVRSGCVGERIFCGDRQLQFRGFGSLVQTVKFARSGNGAIKGHAYSEPRFRKRLQTVQVRDPTTTILPKRVYASLERIAARESQHGIHAVRRKLLRSGWDVARSAIQYVVRS
jgi:hypothetical protein